jgi:hypothetical protein
MGEILAYGWKQKRKREKKRKPNEKKPMSWSSLRTTFHTHKP